jgi:ferredoxin-NADP reductase
LITLNYKAMAGKDVPAVATYSEETGMIRLDAFPSYQPNPSPGHHYYMYFLGFKAWESHPFSLAEWGWPSDIDIARVVTPQGPSSTDKNQEKQSYVKEQQVSSESPGDKIGEHRLTFMIKPRGGMTRQLREKLKKKGSGVPQRVRVFLEGPYGVPAKLETFSNILFIAGGSGITAILPYIRSIADRNKQSNVVAIPNARLIWIAKKEGFVRDVLTRGLRSTLSSSPAHLQAEYYIPEDANTGSGESGNSENDGGEFQYGKPDFDALIRKALLETTDRLAVFVCGPPAMADSIRTLVTILSHQEGNRLELFEELFGW